VAEDDPGRLILLRERGAIPIIASAATVLSLWVPESVARAELHVGEINVPVLVVVGERDSAIYR
jgi:hypothetical protein